MALNSVRTELLPSGCRWVIGAERLLGRPISVYVKRLVDKGLVEKKQDARDRRNWWITLTPMGQAAAEAVVAGAVQYTRDFLGSLNQSEQSALHRLLLKASHGLGFEWQ